MPKLIDRLPEHVTPKVIGVAVTAGFAAAGVASVVARNLRTLSDGEQPLPERVKRVGQESVGALLSGPSGLAARGRDLVTGRQHDAPTEEPSAEPAPPRGIDTSAPNPDASPEPEAAEPEPATEAEQPEPEATVDEPEAGGDTDGPFDLRADLEQMTVAQLRDRAAQGGIPGRSGMKKAELIDALIERAAPGS